MDPELSKLILTLNAAAERARTHPTSLIRYERQGRMPKLRKLGSSKVFITAEFDRWLAGHATAREAARSSVPVHVGIKH